MHSNKDLVWLLDLRNRQLQDFIVVRFAVLWRHESAHCLGYFVPYLVCLVHPCVCVRACVCARVCVCVSFLLASLLAWWHPRCSGRAWLYSYNLCICVPLYNYHPSSGWRAVGFGAGTEHLRWGPPNPAPDVCLTCILEIRVRRRGGGGAQDEVRHSEALTLQDPPPSSSRRGQISTLEH